MEPLLNEMLMVMVVMIGGAVAVSAFFWLAAFSRGDISVVGGNWLAGGMLSALIYLSFILRFSLSGPIVLFPIILVVGLPLFGFLKFLEPSNQKFRWWGFYIVWLYVWIAALIGWRARWWGLLLVTLPALLITMGGTLFLSGLLLPFPDVELYRGKREGRNPGSVPTFGEEIRDFFALLRYSENKDARKEKLQNHRKALRSLISFLLGTNYPYHVVIDEKLAEAIDGDRGPWLTEEEKLIERLDGDLYGSFMAGPGIVLTGCDQAVTLSTGQKFKGAKGPGIVFTDMSDTVANVIDLRPQLRGFPVEARTKDGIAVRVFTFTPFQIGTGDQKPELGKGFPYRTSDVFKAVHAQMVEHTDPSQVEPDKLKHRKWYDLPEIAGERIVRDIISRYEFDELYAPLELYDDFSQHPRAKIGKELAERLEGILPKWGLQRVGSGISNLMPADEQAIEQRIEAWRLEWTRKITHRQAEGQFKRLHKIEQARAQTQIDFILDIGKRFEELRTADDVVPLKDFVLYFIKVLEKLARMPTLRPFLPEDTDSLIQETNQAIREGLVTIGEE